MFDRVAVLILVGAGISDFDDAAELDREVEECREEITRTLHSIDKIEFPPLLEAVEDVPRAIPYHREKLNGYDKRRNFAPKNYWKRIRSNPKQR